jgi:hypothetical protein
MARAARNDEACMSNVIVIPERGYRFIEGVFQYSAGVAALENYRIERVRFRNPVPLGAGFARIAEFLRAEGLPLTAFCACELRSPAPFTDDGFLAFNKRYAAVLAEWGILADGRNPVARSNVCPAIAPPPEPSFHAFSFCRYAVGAERSFVAAGSGESQEGNATYRERTVAYQDVSRAGMRKKAEHVMGVMQARMAALGFAWPDATAVQVYTVHDLYPFLADLIVTRGAASHGLTWHYARPPVIDLEFEMDVRSVTVERVI